ncbi:MAG: TolC family protein [Candidatus Cloacimonadales bacterium]
MKKIILLITLALSSLGWAQHTVYDLIDFGLENSLEIKRAKNIKQTSARQLSNSYWEILPSAQLSASRRQNNDLDDPRITNSESGSFSLGKSLALNEPTYFNIKTNRINYDNSLISLEEQQKNLATAIFEKFIAVLRLQANLDLAQQNLEIQQNIYAASQIQHETGNISNYELENAEINLLSQEIQLQEYRNSLRESRQDLFSYIGMDDTGEELIEPEIARELPEVESYDNNLLQISRNNLDRERVNLWQQKLSLFPMPVISASYDYTNNSDILDRELYEDNLSFGISVSYNIFDIPRLRNNYRNSQRNLEISELSLDYDQTDLRNQIELKLLQIEALNNTLDLYERKLQLAASNFQKAEKQYELGMINLTDLESSRVELFNTQTIRNDKYYDLLRQQEQLNLLLSHKILGKY